MGSCKWIFSVSMIATIMTATVLIVEARRVILRPLTGQEVHDILKEAGREDALPEGRQFTQGIAAIAGYTAGVASGVTGALAYDLITQPNQTLTWINGLFGVTTTTTPKPLQTYKQEICFESRSLKYEPRGRQDDSTEDEDDIGSSPSGSPTSDSSSAYYSPTSEDNSDGNSVGTGDSSGDGSDEPTCITIEKPKDR